MTTVFTKTVIHSISEAREYDLFNQGAIPSEAQKKKARKAVVKLFAEKARPGRYEVELAEHCDLCYANDTIEITCELRVKEKESDDNAVARRIHKSDEAIRQSI